jgi:catechol 2,3-dioxygenase-like lactoylglutathione lyase family enzyme
MRAIQCLVETGIYADDLDKAEWFYRDVLGLTVWGKESGRHVFFEVGDRDMLLVFRPKTTIRGGSLPGNGSHGQGNFPWGVAGAWMVGRSGSGASRRDRTRRILAPRRSFPLLRDPPTAVRPHARPVGLAGRLVIACPERTQPRSRPNCLRKSVAPVTDGGRAPSHPMSIAKESTLWKRASS